MNTGEYKRYQERTINYGRNKKGWDHTEYEEKKIA